MTISEKILHKNLKEVNLYLEGVFWIAYEQSAYYFWKLKGYKPTKKFVKIIEKEVVTVGFPGNVLDEIEICRNQKAEGRKHVVFEIGEGIDKDEFLKWKEGLATVETLRATSLPSPHNSVLEQIKNFDMSTKTPMECMFFLAELKKIITN